MDCNEGKRRNDELTPMQLPADSSFDENANNQVLPQCSTTSQMRRSRSLKLFAKYHETVQKKPHKNEDKHAKSRGEQKSKPGSRVTTRSQLLRKVNEVLKTNAAAKKLIGEPICVTRTVELARTENLEESNKLLFVVALGLTAKMNNCPVYPVVRTRKLDPTTETNAKAKTGMRIFRIFQQLRGRSRYEVNEIDIPAFAPVMQPSQPKEVNIEVVDLSSSDDELNGDEPVFLNEVASRRLVNGSPVASYPLQTQANPNKVPDTIYGPQS
ncbi:6-phosphogluconolactonase [Orchesella cincta]|uniref:6-phosphogluconolactonase n=1 Tax=Orchesella cincta TaxID=48709 RepID=A0A1D2MD74_ORCCI|nr:6-phosphogluconolactonase [Orchesella cincta]